MAGNEHHVLVIVVVHHTVSGASVLHSAFHASFGTVAITAPVIATVDRDTNTGDDHIGLSHRTVSRLPGFRVPVPVSRAAPVLAAATAEATTAETKTVRYFDNTPGCLIT